jgi:hypothetical protein
MNLLARLRSQGLRIVARSGRLLVEPKAAITEATRTTIRINKAALLRELEAETRERHRAIQAACEAAQLGQYRTALLLGRLHLCGNCASFTFGLDPAGPGACTKFGDGPVPFAAPFWCSGFTPSRTPIAPELLPAHRRAPAQEALQSTDEH